MSFWPSVGLGIGLGLFHLSLAMLTHRLARRHPAHATQVELAGVGVRLFVAATVVVLVLVLAPVDQGAFVIAFLVTFVLALMLDMGRLVRRTLRPSSPRSA